MGSIYKALMRASEERQTRRGAAVLSEITVGTTPNNGYEPNEEMLKLLESVESLPIWRRKKVIQFLGSHDGERASVLARQFAEACASGVGLSVLLVEPERPTARLDGRFHLNPARSRPLTSERMKDIERAFRQVKGKNLLVCPGIDEGDPWSAARASGLGPSVLTRIRERFDLVVIPSDPHHGSSEGPAISTHADAVVLVFESEVTESRAAADPNDFGLGSVLENIAQGLLFPQQTLSCLGIPILLLTVPDPDSPQDPLEP